MGLFGFVHLFDHDAEAIKARVKELVTEAVEACNRSDECELATTIHRLRFNEEAHEVCAHLFYHVKRKDGLHAKDYKNALGQLNVCYSTRIFGLRAFRDARFLSEMTRELKVCERVFERMRRDRQDERSRNITAE